MSGETISVTILPNIKAYAAAHSLDLTPGALASLEQVLQSTMRVEAGQVSFTTTAGQTGTLEQALDLHTTGAPRSSTAPPSATGNRTERAIAKVQADRAKLATEAAAAVAAEGNPWSAGSTFNRTHQSIITNKDPALAARLRNEANAPR